MIPATCRALLWCQRSHGVLTLLFAMFFSLVSVWRGRLGRCLARRSRHRGPLQYRQARHRLVHRQPGARVHPRRALPCAANLGLLLGADRTVRRRDHARLCAPKEREATAGLMVTCAPQRAARRLGAGIRSRSNRAKGWSWQQSGSRPALRVKRPRTCLQRSGMETGASGGLLRTRRSGKSLRTLLRFRAEPVGEKDQLASFRSRLRILARVRLAFVGIGQRRPRGTPHGTLDLC